MSAARSSPRRPAVPLELPEGDFTLEVVQGEVGEEEDGVVLTELQNVTDIAEEVQKLEEARDELDDDEEDGDDPEDSDYDPEDDRPAAKKSKIQTIEVEKCSICSKTVADLAIHIVNMHSKAPAPVKTPKKENLPAPSGPSAPPASGEPPKRPGSPSPALLAMRPRKRAYCKGKYQQIKPVLRYPCDACKHVSKTTDQLKKHMIVVHNGHKNTSWMFCGDCEYATRVEEELVNHVKHHQLFKILGDDKDDTYTVADEEEETKVLNPKATKSGMGNYDPVPMNCGDCAFTTHYENELFEHLKAHLRKDANITVDNKEQRRKKRAEIESSVEARTIYEEDDCLHCGICSFSSKSKKNMLRHSNIVHGVVINDRDYQGGTTIAVKQSAYHCTLCKFRGVTREELAAHRKRTIHNKYGGVTAVDPIAEAEERKARIRNNCRE